MSNSSTNSKVLDRLRENDIEGLTSDHIEQVLTKVNRKHSSKETKEEARKGFFSALRKKLGEIWERDGDKIIEGTIRAVWQIITRKR